ncbi:hypothetical protein [Priestia endophytica]|uniref:hypothetical protein n=1 Tax=Priestia endophytica TaxID=135735 RepID=UPI002280B590|nr:hypothetical protein [Priestia endophytica]MCY8235571.1 hypothetical protein [Priestia endophytica]
MNEPSLEDFICSFDTDLEKEEDFKIVCRFPNELGVVIYKSLTFTNNKYYTTPVRFFKKSYHISGTGDFSQEVQRFDTIQQVRQFAKGIYEKELVYS